MKKYSQEFWDNKRFALFSADLSLFPQEFFDRMERRGWLPGIQSGNVDDCLQSLQKDDCSLLIVHDTPDGPASFMLRAQIADPIAIITPTLVVVDPAHAAEAAMLKDFGQPAMVEAADSASSFIDTFEYLTRRWSLGNLRKLTQARKVYISRDFKNAAQLLTALRAEVDVQHLVTPCVAQFLMRQGQYKSVETYLLDALKAYPRNLGLVANLSELYLKAAMPGMTLKVLEAARRNHGNLRPLYQDQIQARLMLNQVKERIPLLESLVRENYRGKDSAQFLARCLMAEGYEQRVESMSEIIQLDPVQFKAAWAKLAG